jgi:DNA-binding response OmpR family regulator
MRLLVAEQDADMPHFYEFVFKLKGWDVHHVVSGELALAEMGKFDAYIINTTLEEGVIGKSIFDVMRANGLNVILTSSYPEYGGERVLIKPFNYQDLFDMLGIA